MSMVDAATIVVSQKTVGLQFKSMSSKSIYLYYRSIRNRIRDDFHYSKSQQKLVQKLFTRPQWPWCIIIKCGTFK